MRAEVCFACAATNRLQQRFAWKWCRQLPEAHEAMKEKKMSAHVTWSIQGKHSCISSSSVFSCVWDIVLGCRLLCNSLQHKQELLPIRPPKWVKIHNMWKPRTTFCSILAAVSVLETTLCIQSVFIVFYETKIPKLTSFGVHVGVEFVKTDVGKSFCFFTRLGRCFCSFVETQMWLKCDR